MTKAKSTKSALMSSVLALVLCFTMFLGTTFAWFTDSVTSAGNKIVAGTLDVDLFLWNSETESIEITEESAPIFGAGSLAQNNNAETLWEPGKTQVAYLSIKNNGNLDLKYQVAIEAYGETNDLLDVLSYSIRNDAKYGDVDAWAGNGVRVLEGINATQAQNVVLKAGQEHFFALSIHMDESAGNEYQEGSASFDIKVLATQLASESDSFDNTYDENAWHPDFVVTNGDELKVALTNGGNVALANDVIISESLPVTKDTVLDLNGKNIGTSGSTTGSPLYLQGGKLTVKNGTLDLDGSHTNVNGTFSAAIGYDAQTELVVENVNFTGKTAINGTFATDGPLKIAISDCTMDVTNLGIAVSANSTEAIATINNCNIDADVYAIFASQGSKITINGGTYKSAGKVITSMYNNTVVTINGGTFDGELWVTDGGSLVIYGGTFTADPSAYVADSYQAVKNADGTWTVKPYAVSTAADLAEAISNGKTAVSISSDITLNTQLAVNGELTIYGNGNTITAPANGTRVVNVIDNTEDVTVTLVDVKLNAADKERGISFYNNSGDLDVTIIDCEITAKYYGVNVAGQNAKATLYIKDSTLTGYCAFQTHSPNTVATFDNCVLEGVNNWYNNTQYPYDNNFATVVVNSLADNSTLTFNNCTVIATEQDSATDTAAKWPATQAHIEDNATGTTINWNDCTFIKNGVEVSAPESLTN